MTLNSAKPSDADVERVTSALRSALADEWDLSYFRRGSRGDYVDPSIQEGYLELTERDAQIILAALSTPQPTEPLTELQRLGQEFEAAIFSDLDGLYEATPQPTEDSDTPLVDEVAALIREHHRTVVREPAYSWAPRRTFHQGDMEAAKAAITIISRSVLAEVAGLRDALAKVMPISVHNGPDYAEVYFADGSTHSTQAMTMNPQDWLDLQAAFDAIESGEINP